MLQIPKTSSPNRFRVQHYRAMMTTQHICFDFPPQQRVDALFLSSVVSVRTLHVCHYVFHIESSAQDGGVEGECLQNRRGTVGKLLSGSSD
jgi:hypothetical protein